MADESYTVRLLHVSGRQETAVFRLNTEQCEDFRVTLASPIGEFSADDVDYFDSLSQIRAELEEIGWRVCCYGTCANTWPGGFCRSMAYGMKVYRLTIGRDVCMDDVLDTFDHGPDVVPVLLSEQMSHYEQWLDTPKQ
jgi:hypothetical protein